MIVATDGKTAYFASDHSGFGQEDIFFFELPTEVRPIQSWGIELDIISQRSGDEIVLQNVQFAHNSFELDSSSYEELDKLIAYLQKHPSVHILIEGPYR